MSERFSWATVNPAGFAAMMQIEKFTRTTVDAKLRHLIKIRASVLNGCAYCLDMHTTEALADGEDQRRLFAVATWREAANLFDEREVAALALTDAVTRLGEHGVPDDVWEQNAKQFTEAELADLILVIGIINVWNRISVSTRHQPPVK
jgi:AhpD family alkylhydroperoxidase